MLSTKCKGCMAWGLLLLGMFSVCHAADVTWDREKSIRELTGSPYVVPGELLKAWNAALIQFKGMEELTSEGRNELRYFVVFSKTETRYSVRLVPKNEEAFAEGAREVEIQLRQRDYGVESIKIFM